MNHITSWENATQIITELRKSKKSTIVSTNGCFDILHPGHCLYLAKARELGDFLIVGLNSDASVQKIKGPTRPVHDAQARATVLKHLKSVDLVCVFEQDNPQEWLRHIKPDIHTKGGDYTAESAPESKVLETWGGRFVSLPFIEGFSTSRSLQKIKNS